MTKVKKKTPEGTFPLPTTDESIDHIMDSRELRAEYFEKFLVNNENEEFFINWLREFLER
jgi:hypothetical protein